MAKKLNSLFLYIVPIVLFAVLGTLLVSTYRYNRLERTGNLIEENYDEENLSFHFDELDVKIMVRNGDSGSWLKDPIYDDDGNMLHGASVGTIYEVVIYNNSVDTVSDWKIKIPINEKMWLNNNWNSKMEVHQDVLGDEKVLAIDLSDYSEYDINLDYYLDHTGPMIPLDVGDYFIYLPEEIAEEKPIAPSKTGAVGEACARFGYIMYIPDQTIDYVADFSGGEILYYMYANPLKKRWFWILIALIVAWAIWAMVTLIVRGKMRNILRQQKLQKEHDEEMIKQTMQLIVNLIETKDMNTKGHSLRVAEYSQKIAERLGYSEEECKDIYYIGLLHDCGKVNIPDEILKNPGRLSDDEYVVMKKHTVYGGEILKDFSSVKDINVGAKYHHERYDGKGYPKGLEGENIPAVARIIGVADAFDAMNSKRCYRDQLPKEVILKELTENKSKQFDPQVVDVVLALIEEGIIEM